MPEPRPPVDRASTSGDLDHLLREVSAEFERLKQWNFELVCENRALRTASGAPNDGPRKPHLHGDGSRRSHFAARLAVDEGAVQQQQPTAGAEEVAAVASQVSKLFGDPDLQQREPAKRTQDLVSNPSHRKELEVQFRRLDIHRRERLCLEDLIRIMQRAEEPIDYAGLLNTLRIFNGLGPLNFSDGGDFNLEQMAESEGLSIDLPAFVRLMDSAESYGDPGSGTEKSIRSLQRACLELEHFHQLVTASKSQQSTQSHVHRGTAFWLETIPTSVILVNTLVTGLSADYDNLEHIWDILEMIFVAFYTVEFLVKVGLFGSRGYFQGPERWWNLFDFVCLLLSLADRAVKLLLEVLWTTDSKPDLTAFLMIKIFRLARLARLVRTLRFKVFHELKVMVVGVISGLRVLTWAIVLLVVMIYLVGVAMTNLFGKDEAEFESVLASMFTMFRCWTDGCAAYDGTPLPEKLREEYGVGFVVLHILMTMFVTVGVFNLIMAIFIDNVVTTQQMRKHKEMGERARDVEQKFKRLFTGYIKNGALGVRNPKLRASVFERARREFEALGREKTMLKGWTHVNLEWERLRNRNITVTRDVFKAWVEDEDFQQLLDEAEIETANHFELFDVLDADAGGALSMDELTTGLMQLRGPVTKADIVAVRLKVSHLTKILENVLPSQGEQPISRRAGSTGGPGKPFSW